MGQLRWRNQSFVGEEHPVVPRAFIMSKEHVVEPHGDENNTAKVGPKSNRISHPRGFVRRHVRFVRGMPVIVWTRSVEGRVC